MTSTIFKNKVPGKRVLIPLSILVWLVLWQMASVIIDNPLLLPLPLDVAKKLSALLVTAPFWQKSFMSFFRIAIGFICGLTSGAFLSLIAHKIYAFRVFFSPAISVLRATPVASFIILVWNFTGSSRLPLFISAIMVLPIIYVNLLSGLDNTDKDLREVARVYELSIKDSLKALYLPQLLPYFTAAVSSALGLSLKSGIAAEVLACTDISIGRELYIAKSTLEITDLFAWTVWMIALSIALEYTGKLIVKILSRRNNYVIDTLK